MTKTKRKYKKRKPVVKKKEPVVVNTETIKVQNKLDEELLKPLKINIPAIVEIMKKTGKKKVFLTYTGLHKHISVSGVGRVRIGERYPVKESIANAFRGLEDWRVDEEYEFES